MSLHRTKATFIGLLEAGRVNEWVVTEKLGVVKSKLGGKTLKKPRIRIGERYVLVQCSRLIVRERFRFKSRSHYLIVNRVHVLELGVGAYLFLCGCYDVAFGKNHYFIYLFLQSIAFFVAGVGYVGTFVPNS